MISAPEPDWIAEVMRDCRSLAFTVSTLRVIPVAFLQSCVNLPFSRVSDAGTKSVHRSQWSVVSCAKAGARPLAMIAAMPPDADSFKTLRRAMRAMISSRHLLCTGTKRCAGTTRALGPLCEHAEGSSTNYASRPTTASRSLATGDSRGQRGLKIRLFGPNGSPATGPLLLFRPGRRDVRQGH